MKNKTTLLGLSLLCLFGLTCSLTGCSNGTSSTSVDEKKPVSFVITGAKTLDISETVNLKIVGNNVEGGVTWTSDAPTIASVDSSGVVTALENGTAMITATSVDDTEVKESVTILVTDNDVSSFEVVFENYDGKVLQRGTVKADQPAIYNGDEPEKISDQFYNYAFSGWNNNYGEGVTEDTTYVAQYVATEIGDDFTFVIQEDNTYAIGAVNYAATEVTLPKYYNYRLVTGVGSSAFANQTSLTKVVFNANYTLIGSGAFENCTALTDIEGATNISAFGYAAFYACTALETVSITGTYTAINGYAFYSCTSLKNLTVATTATKISAYAFAGCVALTGVTGLSDNITYIGEQAFYSCKSLTSALAFKDGLTSLGASSFAFSGITSLSLPSSITSIGKEFFTGCQSLTSIEVTGESDLIEADNKMAFYVNSSNSKVLIGVVPGYVGDSYKVLDGTVEIAPFAFSLCQVKTITFPSTVTTFDNCACYVNKVLENVVFE
ncbi:MAG: leucine-rich repeat protein [Bacilli bacterium]